MTVREDIGQIRKSVNSVSLDTRLTNRFIYNKLLDVTKLIVRREAETRKIYRVNEQFKTLHCVELEQHQSEDCSFITQCGIMRSVLKIPKTFLSSTGSIIHVYNVNKTLEFTQTTPSLYVDISEKKYKGPQRYFWIENDYLILPDSFVEKVIVTGLFINNSEVDVFNGAKCSSLLDSDSSIPDSVRADVMRTVSTEIAGVTKRIPEDESPELNSNKIV